MEKKCKECGTTKDVNFDGLCKECYEKSIKVPTAETIENQKENNNFIDMVKEKLKDVKLKETIKTIAIVFLLFLIFCFAMSDDSQRNIELSNQVEELTQQTEELKGQLTDVNSKLENSTKELEEKTKELTTLQETNKTLQDEKAKLEEDKQNLNQEIEDLKTSKANKSTTTTSTKKTSSTPASNASLEVETTSTSNSYTVYITDTGKKYHSTGCSYLRKSQHAISKSSAVSQGYTACSRCNP